MLRVGLTGDLGSGKSTVAAMLAARGAFVMSSDEMGRAMMQPGHAVYNEIVERFGAGVVLPGGQLDRRELARLAFDLVPPRVEELNAIVHPAVIAEQARRLAELAGTEAIAVVESALIFTSVYAGDEPWRDRFDTIVCVTAPTETKVQRFVARARGASPWDTAQTEAARADAHRRLQLQQPAEAFQKHCLTVANDGTRADLELRVEALWGVLQRLAAATRA
jgi:dephospho-CoA kinase